MKLGFVGCGTIAPSNQAVVDAADTVVLAVRPDTVGGHQLIARVNGQNVTDKRYRASVGGSSLAENLPAVVKFSLAFKY